MKLVLKTKGAKLVLRPGSKFDHPLTFQADREAVPFKTSQLVGSGKGRWIQAKESVLDGLYITLKGWLVVVCDKKADGSSRIRCWSPALKEYLDNWTPPLMPLLYDPEGATKHPCFEFLDREALAKFTKKGPRASGKAPSGPAAPKAPPKPGVPDSAGRVFAGTLGSKRVLCDAGDGHVVHEVPKDAAPGAFAATKGLKYVPRSAAAPEAAKAYEKAWKEARSK